MLAHPYIVELQIPILFLVAPLVFYGLGWTELRYIFEVELISDYLEESVITRIRQILGEISPEQERDFGSIMGWESRGAGLVRHFNFTIALIEGAGYGIAVLAALLSVCAYFVLIVQSSQPVPLTDIILIVLNAVALIYSVYWGFRAALHPM